MPDYHHNEINATSVSVNIKENNEEGLQKMEIEEKGELNKYPDRPGEPDCGYYMKTGFCSYGSNCRYNHPPEFSAKDARGTSELPQREGQPDCGYYLKTGTCKYGSTCKYHHPLDRHGVEQVQLNALALPIRPGEKSCPYYIRNHNCKFGSTCKFNHPDPSTLPVVSGSASHGTMGSTLLSNGISYPGVYPTWPGTGLPYMASSQVPFPVSYVPFGFPAMQGSIPTQNWDGYVGNMNAVSAFGMDPNTKSQGELVDLSSMAIADHPERPGQPECRYFMVNGTCKYGQNCKFNHPKERSAQLGTETLGPHGLPLRPGKTTCSFFKLCGVCKFGPTCKFNHPVAGYYVGMTSMPMTSSVSTQMNPIVSANNNNSSSDTKPSKITSWIQNPDEVTMDNKPKTDEQENSHQHNNDNFNIAAPSTSQHHQQQTA